MADPTGVLYADTSALVKLAVEEPETRALRIELNRWDTVATSVITEIEHRVGSGHFPSGSPQTSKAATCSTRQWDRR